MKTTRLTNKSIALSALLMTTLGLSAPAALTAGPGSEYWRSLGQPKAVEPVKEIQRPCPLGDACPDFETAGIYENKPTSANGRGPTQMVQVGSKLICHTCAGTTTFMRSTHWNGRPPLVAVEVRAKHDCNVKAVELGD